MNLTLWCNRIIRFGFYLLFILIPLVLTPWNYELFEYNKMMLTYGLTIVILGAWVVKMIDQKEIKIAKTPLDIPLVLFVSSQLIASLFSIDKHVSWFGYYSRFNGGMLSVIAYVVLFYAFVTNLSEDVKKILKVIATTALVVAGYGLLEHFGIDKNLWVQDVQGRVFSTLGQPNWLAAYLAALIPSAIFFSIKDKPKQTVTHIFAGFTAIIFFVVILFTRSRSGLLGLAVADVSFWILLFVRQKNKKSLATPCLLLHAAFAVIVFFNGTYIEQVDKWVTITGWTNRLTHKAAVAPTPQATGGTMLEQGGTESGTIRKYVWQAAVSAWLSSTKTKLIGTGTETFAFAFYEYRPRGHNMTSEWDFLYNKAHNEYLNYLATTGAFGLGSYLLIIGVFLFWFARRKHHTILNTSLFAGWLSLLVTNFFGFSVVVIQLLFFLFPAMLFNGTEKSFRTLNLRGQATVASFLWSVPILGMIGLIVLVRFWQADTLYAAGYRLGRSGDFAGAQTLDMQAISLNPGEPIYHDELASTLSSLAVSAVDQKNATLAAQLAKESLTQSDIALQKAPNNVNFWKTRTKIYYSFSAFDPRLNQAAIEALEKARSLSPNDPKILYNLAILYGRDAKNDKAIELLTLAKELKPDYRDAYFGLYVFYTELKQTDKARAELQYYLDHVNSTDKDFLERINR